MDALARGNAHKASAIGAGQVREQLLRQDVSALGGCSTYLNAQVATLTSELSTEGQASDAKGKTITQLNSQATQQANDRSVLSSLVLGVACEQLTDPGPLAAASTSQDLVAPIVKGVENDYRQTLPSPTIQSVVARQQDGHFHTCCQ